MQRPSQLVLDRTNKLSSQQIAIPAKEFMECINEMQARLLITQKTQEKKRSSKQIFSPIAEDPRSNKRISETPSSILSLSPFNSIPNQYSEPTEVHRKLQYSPIKENSMVSLDYSNTTEEKISKRPTAQRHGSIPPYKEQKKASTERYRAINSLKLQGPLPNLDDKQIEMLHSRRELDEKALRASCMAKFSGNDDENDFIVFDFVEEKDEGPKLPQERSSYWRNTLEVPNNELPKRISVYRTKEFKFLATRRSKSGDFRKESFKNAEKMQAEELSPAQVQMFANYLVPNLKLKQIQPQTRTSYVPSSQRNLEFSKSPPIRDSIQLGNSHSRYSDTFTNLEQDFLGSLPKGLETREMDFNPSRFSMQDDFFIGRTSHNRRNETTRLEFEILLNEIQPETRCIQDEEQPIAQVKGSNPIVATKMFPVLRIGERQTVMGRYHDRKSHNSEYSDEGLGTIQELDTDRYREECRESITAVVYKQEKLRDMKKSSTLVSESPKTDRKDQEDGVYPEMKRVEAVGTASTRDTVHRQPEKADDLSKEVEIEEQPAAPMRGEGEDSFVRRARRQQETSALDNEARSSLKRIPSDEFWKELENQDFLANKDPGTEQVEAGHIGYRFSENPKRDTIESPERVEEEKDIDKSLVIGQRETVHQEFMAGETLQSFEFQTKPQVNTTESVFPTTGLAASIKDAELNLPFLKDPKIPLRDDRNQRFAQSQVIETQKMPSTLKFSQQLESKASKRNDYANPFQTNPYDTDAQGINIEKLDNLSHRFLLTQRANDNDLTVYNSGYLSADQSKLHTKRSIRSSILSRRGGRGNKLGHTANARKSKQKVPNLPGEFKLKLEKMAEKSEKLLYESLYESPRTSTGRRALVQKSSRFRTHRNNYGSPEGSPQNQQTDNLRQSEPNKQRRGYFNFDLGNDESFEYQTTFESRISSPREKPHDEEAEEEQNQFQKI